MNTVRSTLSSIHTLPKTQYEATTRRGLGIRRFVGLHVGREKTIEDIFRTLDITNKTNEKSILIKNQIISIFNILHDYNPEQIQKTILQVNSILKQLKYNLKSNPSKNFVLTKITDYIHSKQPLSERVSEFNLGNNINVGLNILPRSVNNLEPVSIQKPRLTPENVYQELSEIKNLEEIENEQQFINTAKSALSEGFTLPRNANQVIRIGIQLWRQQKNSRKMPIIPPPPPPRYSSLNRGPPPPLPPRWNEINRGNLPPLPSEGGKKKKSTKKRKVTKKKSTRK